MYLSQNFKFFSFFVKVDEPVLHSVRYGGVYHHQVRQEGAEIWDRAVVHSLCKTYVITL